MAAGQRPPEKNSRNSKGKNSATALVSSAGAQPVSAGTSPKNFIDNPMQDDTTELIAKQDEKKKGSFGGNDRYSKKNYRQKSNDSKEKMMDNRVFSSETNDIEEEFQPEHNLQKFPEKFILNEGKKPAAVYNEPIIEEIDPVNEESIKNMYSFKQNKKNFAGKHEQAFQNQAFSMQEEEEEEREQIDEPLQQKNNHSNIIDYKNNNNNQMKFKANGAASKESASLLTNGKKNRSDGFNNPSMVIFKEENESQQNFWNRGSGSYVNPPQNITVLKARLYDRERNSVNIEDYFENAISADASKLEGGSFKFDLSLDRGERSNGFNGIQYLTNNDKKIKILTTEEALDELEMPA